MQSTVARTRTPTVLVLSSLLLCLVGAACGAGEEGYGDWVNPWRKASGELSDSVTVVRDDKVGFPLSEGLGTADVLAGPVVENDSSLSAEAQRAAALIRNPDTQRTTAAAGPATSPTQLNRYLGGSPMAERNSLGSDSRAMLDRGIDSEDVKWRRQARLSGVQMRMLNGPELAYAGDGYNSNTERGLRNDLGMVMPLNPRWELALLNGFGMYHLKETGGDAGTEALAIRVGANPSVSFRPWFGITPYTRLWDGNGYGVGFNGGAEKTWRSGMMLRGEVFAYEPWDEGYDTAVEDGRRHGFAVQGTMPVDRRLTLSGGFGYEWLELGPHARSGSQYAGRRYEWNVRAEYIFLRRDGAFMGYGFREPELWNEQLVPVELGVFGEVSGQRYFRPNGFTALNPTEKSLRERIGILYNQAISPHLGFNSEAYVGQDPRRRQKFGDVYGISLRLTMVVNPHLRFWGGWGYDSETDTMESQGGPTSSFNFGMNYNF